MLPDFSHCCCAREISWLDLMPFAAAGETLAERAQRILGVDLDSWLSDSLVVNTGNPASSKNMPASTSIIENGAKPIPATRTEQILHAQRYV